MNIWLSPASFANYPPQGKELAVSRLAALRQIPVALLPVFLVDLGAYDWKFPVEQQEIAKRIDFAGTNPLSLTGFRKITVPPTLDNSEKTVDPQRFLAEMTAHLWSSLQMDAYRSAANQFVAAFAAAAEPIHPVLPRLVMICVGKGAREPTYQLFSKLRKFGQMRTNVRSEGAAYALLDVLHRRSENHPIPYTHWYVDGGDPMPGSSAGGVTQIAYPALKPLNEQILAKMKSCIDSGTGPEVLHLELAKLIEETPSGKKSLADRRLQHFALSVLTEGSGTQIFATSFVQWTTREVLRRAQPATMLVRFAPRQRQKSFNAMIESVAQAADLDPEGSLIDADMSAYYAFLELKRLPDADATAFLVWFEEHSQAFVASKGIPTGAVDHSPVTMPELLSQLLSKA